MEQISASLQRLFNPRERFLRRATQLMAKEHFYAALTAYRRAAQHGSVEAMLALASMCERGEGTPISFPQALEWYQAAAEKGHVDGHFGAGSCLMRMELIPRGVRGWYQNIAGDEPERAAELGALLGTRMDLEDPYKLAREYLIEACRQGHKEAPYRLAELLVRGLGGERDAKQAHDLYIVAAAAGIAGAEYGLAELYRQGEGCEGNSDTAFIWYKRAAGKGHLPAQLIVAQHMIARATPDDLIEARLWLRPGSEQGVPHADFLLAMIDLTPTAPQRDEERAKAHLHRAAAKGHLHAMKRLAQIFDEGRLSEARNTTEAAGWYKKAAEAGDVEAQFALGRMYARGEGVPQISASAARWFAKSAEGGHSLAQFNYAIFLERGEGVPVDVQAARDFLTRAGEQGLAAAQFKLGRDLLHENSAVKIGLDWLEKAASQEHVGSLALLGLFYSSGDQITRDPRRAIAYLQHAAALGHAPSHLHLARLLHAERAPIQEVIETLIAGSEAGSVEAEFTLSRMYFAADGVDSDVPKAMKWLESAASHGHPQALFDLAVRNCLGDGVTQDILLGAKLYQNAGEAGHIAGKFNYAMMILGPRGIEGDHDLARRFLRDAARAGLSEAIEACRTYQVNYEHEVDSDEFDQAVTLLS